MITPARIWRACRRRWLLRRDLRRALSAARTILIVCKGNKYRGPFAEALARRSMPAGVECASRALRDEQGASCPDTAIEAARSYGIDLSAHRSCQLTPADIERSDVVLVFEDTHVGWLARHYPQAAGKVYPIGILLWRWDYGLGDHAGRDLPEVRRMYRLIAVCCRRAAALSRIGYNT